MGAEVKIGSRWRMPPIEDEDTGEMIEEIVEVGALVWDGTEHTALCVSVTEPGGVMHLPASTLAKMALPLPDPAE